MLHVNGLTYRIGPRVLFDNATVALPPDARVGFLAVTLQRTLCFWLFAVPRDEWRAWWRRLSRQPLACVAELWRPKDYEPLICEYRNGLTVMLCSLRCFCFLAALACLCS